MAVPQRRISKTRKRMRRTHFKLTPAGLVKCKHCGEMIKPHIVCPHCGYYNGKLVVKSKAMKKEEAAKANENKKEVKKDKKKEEKK